MSSNLISAQPKIQETDKNTTNCLPKQQKHCIEQGDCTPNSTRYIVEEEQLCGSVCHCMFRLRQLDHLPFCTVEYFVAYRERRKCKMSWTVIDVFQVDCQSEVWRQSRWSVVSSSHNDCLRLFGLKVQSACWSSNSQTPLVVFSNLGKAKVGCG